MIELRCALAGAGRKIASLTLASLLLASASAEAKPAGKEPAGKAAPASAGAAPAPASAPAPCAGASVIPTSAAMTRAAGDAVLCLVNVERSQRGLASLLSSELLSRAASIHSTDMVRNGYFGHVSPTGQDVRKRVARTGYLRGARAPSLGETIAWGSDYYGSPAALVTDLMTSAPHRATILDRRFRDIGIGLSLGAPLDGMGSGVTLSLSFGRR